MKIIRKPAFNAAIVAVISGFYAAIFIITSNHIEFERILDHSATLRSPFWNGWSEFLRQGQQKYIGYIYILLAAVIVIFSVVRRRDYDEYQGSLLGKGLIASGIAMTLLFPIMLLLILSDSNYAAEYVMFLIAAHWLAVLLTDALYAIKWSRN